MGGPRASSPDRALRVVLPESEAEVVGALLMEWLGPFAEEPLGAAAGGPAAAAASDTLPTTGAAPDMTPSGAPGMTPSGAAPDMTPSGAAADFASSGTAPAPRQVRLTFYPETGGTGWMPVSEVEALLPRQLVEAGLVSIDTVEVERDWEEGWKDHFHPIVVGGVRIRPPWESPAGAGLIDVAINPGMGFGTGLHPTTRGTLGLLQSAAGGDEPGAALGGGGAGATSGAAGSAESGGGSLGPLMDAGTGSGVLAIAAAKLGWSPIVAFDNDPVALVAAAENVAANGVGGVVSLMEADISTVELGGVGGATLLANMTLDPVSRLLERLAEQPLPARIVVSGILAGDQEARLVALAASLGFAPGRRVYEAEWVSMELLPAAVEAR